MPDNTTSSAFTFSTPLLWIILIYLSSNFGLFLEEKDKKYMVYRQSSNYLLLFELLPHLLTFLLFWLSLPHRNFDDEFEDRVVGAIGGGDRRGLDALSDDEIDHDGVDPFDVE